MSRLGAVKPRAIRQQGERARPVLPRVVEAPVAGAPLPAWLGANAEWLAAELRTTGGVLFRGFGVADAAAFGETVRAIAPERLEYRERSTPRTEVGERIYTSTEYPAHQHIALHNEFSYAYTWPMRIFFYAAQPAEEGGETPIADSRRVYAAIPAEIRERFARLGVLYARNYGSGVDLSWQEAFQTGSRAEVEAYCRQAPLEFEWREGDRLRTRQRRPAVARHRDTGEMVWFNQAHLFHVSNLGDEGAAAMRSLFGEEELPRHAFYGDGSAITDEELAKVREAMAAETVAFPWQAQDVLVLDNMLIAHGRHPYRGQRRILAALAEPYSLAAAERTL